jgi:two-component sensor histidine kinase
MDNIIATSGEIHEMDRLAAVRRYDILDTPPDGAFDRITAIAARRFNVPISIISIVDHDRIWFKSHHGLPIEQIDRDDGLCATTILSAAPRILTDAKTDYCALANPLVAGNFGLRFYAGVPLRTHDGFNLGTLCVIDNAPRPVEPAEIEDLEDLAAVVMDELELRISARQAIEREKLLKKEIDHRVMNSLQFVSSMLTLQSLALNADATAELKRAANRVAAVAQVHRNFYSQAASTVSCLDFLRRLCADFSGILGQTVKVTGHDGMVPTTMIQPIGLITSEFVTNAAKAGAGRIRVDFTVSGDGIAQLRVCNNGDTLPADFNPETSNGLGMRLVLSLVKHLKGRLEAGESGAGGGARFTVTFPVG